MKRIAIVGFGFMGMTHAKSILKINDLELTAIVDKDLDGINDKLSSETGNFSTGEIDTGAIEKINKYEYLTTCLDSEEIDAVIISVHTDLHYSLTKEALEAGKHVFLEKPFCLDIEEGEELIEIAEEKGLILMIGHVLRFMLPYQMLKNWIDTNEYGKLEFLSLSRFSGLPAWGQWKEKQADFGSSGGALFDLLIHDIDFVQYVLGKPQNIESEVIPGALSDYDYISTRWEYPGLKVKLEGGNTFHTNFPFQAGYMAAFEKASILYTTLQPENIQVTNDEEVIMKPVGDGDGFFNEMEYFGNCIVNGTKPEICLPESALETIELCYKHI